jgi:hypothetical protein
MKSFNRHLTEQVIYEAIEYHLENSIPFDECVFRYGSEKYFDFYNGLREAYNNGVIPNYIFNEEELEIIESDLGTFAEYAGETVPLDFIMEEETPELNKPKRGGTRKFRVFVRNPQTGNIKKIDFGDTTGLSVKYDNPERKKAFAARHNCADANDKLSRSYWACRVNRYLGKTPQARAGFW